MFISNKTYITDSPARILSFKKRGCSPQLMLMLSCCVFCTNLSSSPRSQIKEGIGISSFVLQVCFPSTWADSIPLRALWQNVLPKKLLNAAWLSLLSAAWHHTIEEIWHVQVWGQLGEDLAGKRTAPTPVSLLIEEPTKDWLHTVGNILIRW